MKPLLCLTFAVLSFFVYCKGEGIVLEVPIHRTCHVNIKLFGPWNVMAFHGCWVQSCWPSEHILFTLYDINLLSHVRFSLTPEKVMITSFVCFIRKTISHSLSAQSKGSLYFDTFKTYCELSSVYLYITGK